MSEASTFDPRHCNPMPDYARDARAHAWAFAFECYRMKKGARPGALDDGTESKEDSADASIIQD